MPSQRVVVFFPVQGWGAQGPTLEFRGEAPPTVPQRGWVLLFCLSSARLRRFGAGLRGSGVRMLGFDDLDPVGTKDFGLAGARRPGFGPEGRPGFEI